MIQTLYLAECSKTYRYFIPRLLQNYAREVVDLWENPTTTIEHSSNNLILIDESFAQKGPGPACAGIRALMDARSIVASPIIILTRRESRLPRNSISGQTFQLRRPFETKDLYSIFEKLGISPVFLNEVSMSENIPLSSEEIQKKIDTFTSPQIDAAQIEAITRETVERVVRELVPQIAEKLIREEIQRLTE